MGRKTTSDAKKKRYAAGPSVSAANKIRKIKKQIKQQPNDLQAKADLQRLGA